MAQPATIYRSSKVQDQAFAEGLALRSRDQREYSALGLLLVLTDKIVLSRLLTLEEFGYYTLAGVVAASLYLLINPVYNAVFPRLTQLVTLGDQTSIA